MKRIFLVLSAIVLLSACGLTKEKLGMTRSTPDESQISPREKLVLPPDFGVRPEVKE